MTIDEALRIDDIHADDFLKQAWREAAIYELEQKEKENIKRECDNNET